MTQIQTILYKNDDDSCIHFSDPGLEDADGNEIKGIELTIDGDGFYIQTLLELDKFYLAMKEAFILIDKTEEQENE